MNAEQTKKPQQVPSVGRVVHYTTLVNLGRISEPRCRAALVVATHLDPQLVELVVFEPGGMFFADGVRYSESAGEPATWHWPEYVPAR